MEFRNLTPLDTLCFKTLDVEDNEFHVVVMKIAYTLKDGECIVDETDLPSLIFQDEFKGEMNQSSVRFESDLAPAKPQCDVLVNAIAYAPDVMPDNAESDVTFNEKGEITSFITNLTIKDGQDRVLLDKSLLIRGEEQFHFSAKTDRKGQPKEILTSPTMPIKSLPLDYEYAFGGEHKIYSDSPYAQNVAESAKLTEAQKSEHPEEIPPIAHTMYEANLLGRGFIEPWYLATVKDQAPLLAPQILYPNTAFTVDSIQKQLGGDYSMPEFTPAGYGAVSRTAPHRRAQADTYDENWLENRHPYLPADFEFSYWNCAPIDQQIEFPPNEMKIHLKNMTQEGDWQIHLPAHRAFVLVKLGLGGVIPVMLNIDTLIVEPIKNQVLLTYRGLFPAKLNIKTLEARFEVDPNLPLIKVQGE